MNIETDSANFRTMGEAVKAEVIPQGSSGAYEVLPKKMLILLKIWM